MTTIGDDEIKALEDLLAKGTPGPWDVWMLRAIEAPRSHLRDENARLIVAAVNALPRLLARLREAEGERDALRALVSRGGCSCTDDAIGLCLACRAKALRGGS